MTQKCLMCQDTFCITVDYLFNDRALIQILSSDWALIRISIMINTWALILTKCFRLGVDSERGVK